jgi:hypothetical protein
MYFDSPNILHIPISVHYQYKKKIRYFTCPPPPATLSLQHFMCVLHVDWSLFGGFVPAVASDYHLGLDSEMSASVGSRVPSRCSASETYGYQLSGPIWEDRQKMIGHFKGLALNSGRQVGRSTWKLDMI